MKEIQALNSVALFHKTFGHPIEANPLIPKKERIKLRLLLLEEELAELKDAIERNDITEVADAFCDIQYVLSGAILEFGLGERISKLFEEVQRSNMSKACKTKEEAVKTIEFYKKGKNEPCYSVHKEGQYLVYREADNKLMKSINYSPAILKPILEEE